MSEATTNPFGAMIRMQRRSIEQTRKAMHEGAELNKRMSELFMESMDASQSVQRRSNDLARTAVEAYFDAVESSMPGDATAFRNVQTILDDQFEAMDEVSEQSWEAFESGFEDNVEAYEEFVDRFAAMMDDSFEAYADSMDEFERMSSEAVQIDVDVDADEDHDHHEA
jgi:hypothetical protein